jgi:hypothetical protein
MSRRTGAFVASMAVGLVGGLALARWRHGATRRDLFDPSAWRRLGALGWLERRDDPAMLPLLRDYLAWERRPELVARASRVVRRLERAA